MQNADRQREREDRTHSPQRQAANKPLRPLLPCLTYSPPFDFPLFCLPFIATRLSKHSAQVKYTQSNYFVVDTSLISIMSAQQTRYSLHQQQKIQWITADRQVGFLLTLSLLDPK